MLRNHSSLTKRNNRRRKNGDERNELIVHLINNIIKTFKLDKKSPIVSECYNTISVKRFNFIFISRRS